MSGGIGEFSLLRARLDILIVSHQGDDAARYRRSRMKVWLWMFATAAALVSGAALAQDVTPGKDGQLEESADALLFGVPAVAFGLTWILDKTTDAGADEVPTSNFSMTDFTHLNGSPRHDFGLATLRTLGITYGLKYGIDAPRPNGKSGSFPSAHAAVTFSGAEFIRKHYGWGWGAPAYLAASYVGWSRVQTDHHFGRDVLAGAAIGILSNHDWNSGWLKITPILVPRSEESQYRDHLSPASVADALGSSIGIGVQFDL